MKKILLVCLIIIFNLTATSFAMQREVDFSYKKVSLGMSYEEMVNLIGEPKVQFVTFIGEYAVDEYVYNDVRIDFDLNTKKIVFISIKDKKYENNQGVKIGSTLYKLNKEYGKGEKQIINGKKYYIYQHEQNPDDKLLLDVSNGYVEKIITAEIGKAAVILGAGREYKDQAIDLSVGINMLVEIGDAVKADTAVAVIEANDLVKAELAKNIIQNSIKLSSKLVLKPKLILGVVDKDGFKEL